MKATRKTVSDAIECLLTCAAARQAGDRYAITSRFLLCDSDAETLADRAWVEIGMVVGDHTLSHRYGAAASLLHDGWLPEGWTR